MKILLKHSWLVLALFIETETTFVTNDFSRLKQGQNMTGNVGAEIMAGSSQECALR